MNDVMRQQYRELSDLDKENIKAFKDLGAQFYTHCDTQGASLELSLAKTKIEEAVMWAVKHVTK